MAHTKREKTGSERQDAGEEKRKKREGRKKMLKPRGKTEAGGDRSVGGTQAGDAGRGGAVQVGW
jgi:hypothetical protein